ncbi:PWWP domain-containing DNA repair factor 3A [Orycteropus afer afer]|uniref:PWWP domain-containing DNA repair factor 3A n=1 Tax=Orycteropus afer afer TaxID=1230840 RepID=A0A8B7AYZ5_ORYAF|nr:PWWP domain-containing DNA repair factor 3A [Orycteropus afer afer]
MTDAKYVLCRWKKRLWPAKVLSRTETSTKNKRIKELFLDVQILSLNEKIKVKSAEVRILKKSEIEDIAASLALQNEAPAAPLEELVYRRSLRVALDMLNEGTPASPECPSGEERVALSPSAKPTGMASSRCGSHPAASHREDASGTSPPGRRRWTRHSWSGSSTCKDDLKCTVDATQRPGDSRDPGVLPAPQVGADPQDGGRSQTHRKAWPRPSQKGRKCAWRPSSHRKDLSSCSGVEENGSKGKAGTPPALASCSQVREDDSHTSASGGGLVSSAGSPPAFPASPQKAVDTCRETGPHCPTCLDAGGVPAKRLRLDGSHRPSGGTSETGPVTLHDTAEHAPVTCTHRLHLPDPKNTEQGCPPSEGSVEFKPPNSILEEDEEEEEPPRILLYHEPPSFEVGMLVWLKYQKYPFWPAVVKSLRRRDKKASVLFIEGNMNPKARGITVSLRRLKHFDCGEKQALLHKAKQEFEQAVGWCVSLITDYRVRLGCGSFTGSFLEYYAAAISYPVRKCIQQDTLGAAFPQLSGGDAEKPEAASPLGQSQPCRKVLPDRSRAARDRANQRLVEYIVKAKGAESHLRAILKSRKPSRWLKTFLSSSQYVRCVETYLEDEEQLDLVVKYLQGVCQETGSSVLTRVNGDRIRFILDVLLPEAIICAISAVDAVDYKTAEEKYIKGPSLSYREKEIFDNQLLEERNRRRR